MLIEDPTVTLKPHFCFTLSFFFSSLFLWATETVSSTPDEAVDNMHHLMEYVFEPRYKELKEVVALSPSKKRFKKVKACGLTLAEAANLLIRRSPEDAGVEEKELWVKYARDVREQASILYQAARKKDHPQVVAAYRQTIGKCNVCHQKFADGKYQLSP